VRETSRAKQAYADYVKLGPSRSLDKLLAGYQGQESPPTIHISVLKDWSAKHDWQARLRADADAEIREARDGQSARRRQVLESDLALDFERVDVLITLAKKLTADLTGKRAKFDEAKYRQLRGILDDIAKEVGDRAQRHEYIMVEKKAQELAAERGIDPGRVINLATALAKRGKAS
jgi:hypothetical protein